MNIKKIYLGTIATMVAVTPIVTVSCGDKKSNKITAEEQRKMDLIQSEELKSFESKLPHMDLSMVGPVTASWWAKELNGKTTYNEKIRAFLQKHYGGIPIPPIPKEVNDKLLTTIELKKHFMDLMFFCWAWPQKTKPLKFT